MTFEEAAEKMGITPDAFRSFCEKWAITEVSLFGSILRDDFGPDSDVDLLVTYAPDAGWSLLDVIGAKQELEELIGRNVDLVDRHGVERSENPYRRTAILSEAQLIHES